MATRSTTIIKQTGRVKERRLSFQKRRRGVPSKKRWKISRWIS